MSYAAHPELHLLKSTLRSIHESLADFRPLAARPPILDSSSESSLNGDSANDAQWLQQENIPGLKQLRDALKIDLDVLERFLDDPNSANLPPLSTNAPYLIAVYNEVLCAPPQIVSIFKSFPLAATPAQKMTAAKVDVVADSGRRWIRVNTIKNTRLMSEFREIDSYLTDSDSDDEQGPSLAQTELDNSVLRMGRALVAAANAAHPIDRANVTLRLTRLTPCDTDPRIAQTLTDLRAMGIDVQLGERPADAIPAPPPPRPLAPAQLVPTAHINLDLSVLIALVSDLTHAPLPASLDAAHRRFAPAPAPRPQEPSPTPPTQARALTSQIMREMLQEMRAGPLFPALRARLPEGVPLQFWTTREARVRFERIVGKIGGLRERQRAAALFEDAGADGGAEARFWAESRYAPGFVALLPVRLYDDGVDEDADADAEADAKAEAPRAAFFRAMEGTCRGILAQEQQPDADEAPRVADAEERVQYSNNGYRRNPDSERATATRANARLTAHTVESMLCGARRGWTTLTANRTSVRALLREISAARAAGRLAAEEDVREEGEEAAAIWILDPRSLAEGARARAEASYET
ncbi:hypothetical protein DFH09DRAFT_975401 [Mycena vulgaris]|nr:hypothetical protein DFH09DRAFT_975401 [Mycena vulgaris]